jgi:uncharacterized protein YeaO (DUF488 family)
VSIRVVRLGTARLPEEGLRIGTVRRPPRGVRKAEFSSRNYYDLWLPALSPSAEAVAQALSARLDIEWKRFVRQYRREMAEPSARALLDVLAALSHQTNFSVGCYCADESRCHRSVLRELLREHGALLLPTL